MTEPTQSAEYGRLRALVEWMDNDLDGAVADTYKNQPLAQDWARVGKVSEEVGEAIDALIGMTAQNPRKGQYGRLSDLLTELADVALTGLYAMQHFTKNADMTMDLLMARAEHHHTRRAAQIDGPESGHDAMCESENVHGKDTPCWCDERALNDGAEGGRTHAGHHETCWFPHAECTCDLPALIDGEASDAEDS